MSVDLTFVNAGPNPAATSGVPLRICVPIVAVLTHYQGYPAA
jgi:hypothetical protein